ncbi:hypothetical protein BC629DRAFT_1445417 [Irpex lacteus]|nr:hypothetical protein BC629DRAFT_1445417 [Irpex lacteus]
MSRPPLRSFFVSVDLKRRNTEGHVIEDRGNDVASCTRPAPREYANPAHGKSASTLVVIKRLPLLTRPRASSFLAVPAESLHTYGGGRSVDTAAQQAETARPINVNSLTLWAKYRGNPIGVVWVSVESAVGPGTAFVSRGDMVGYCGVAYYYYVQIYLRLVVDRYPPAWARTPMFTTDDQYSILMFAPMSGGGGGRGNKKPSCASVALASVFNMSLLQSNKDVSFRSTADVNASRWNTAVRGTGSVCMQKSSEKRSARVQTTWGHVKIDGEEDKGKLENLPALQGW